jgi:hypothetical protein
MPSLDSALTGRLDAFRTSQKLNIEASPVELGLHDVANKNRIKAGPSWSAGLSV